MSNLDSEILRTPDGKILEGSFILTPKAYEDERGFFYESWNKRTFDTVINKKTIFVQDNHSRSSRGVLRGLHYQISPMEQDKLVKCSLGSIFDVAVDLRKDSLTYGYWGGVKLSEKNKKQLWVPKGFAHGFLTLSEYADVQYKITNYWNKDYERAVRWDDPKIKIAWPTSEVIGSDILVSKKDQIAPMLKEVEDNGDIFT